MSRCKSLSVLVLGLWLLFSQSAWADDDVLTIGIVPQQSASKLARLWGPILVYLSERSGVSLRFKTAPNIPTFEQRCADGEYDLAYMNPYHYTVFHEAPGYEAFARQGNKRIKGIMVVRKDSPIKSLEDLQGSTLAFPSPAAFAASVLSRAELKQQNISFTPKYVSSHDSVYRTVAKGLYPAGGGIVRTFNNVAPIVHDQLRVLWTSNGFTPHAFAAHPRVEPSKVQKVQAALVAMAEDEDGQRLLKSIRFKPLTAAEDADWDDVRALGLDVLKALIKG